MQKLIFPILAGILSGFSAVLFLTSLQWVTAFRVAHPDFVYGLPIAGLVIGYLYHLYGREISPGTNLIIDEIHNPKKTLPFRMAPLIYLTTLITHLFGGSAGREGTAVQIGASLADQLGIRFQVLPEQRKALLLAGVGSAFGAAIGAPFAGIFFGIEIVRAGKIHHKPVALLECALASFAAFAVTHLFHAPHTIFPAFPADTFHFSNFGFSVLAALVFGLLTRFFIWTTHRIENLQAKIISHPPLRPLIGGILLVFCFQGFSLQEYEGLGLGSILSAFHQASPPYAFLLKLLLTALTLGSGFKGGEFVPLVFIGATAGSALAGYFHLPLEVFAALGCVALFGSAAKAPFSCSIMAMELFGWKIAPFAFLVCYLSTFVSGRMSIYKEIHEPRPS